MAFLPNRPGEIFFGAGPTSSEVTEAVTATTEVDGQLGHGGHWVSRHLFSGSARSRCRVSIRPDMRPEISRHRSRQPCLPRPEFRALGISYPIPGRVAGTWSLPHRTRSCHR